MELPAVFQENMKMLLKREYPSYVESFSQPRVYGLRTNRLKLPAGMAADKIPCRTEPIPWIDNGYYYEGSERPAKHPYYYAGLYYLQEPSAMTPANRLPIEPGDKVLDLCAAPGGKSTELGAKLGGTGLLVTNDISNSRAQALLKNIELFGIANVCVMSEAPYRMVPKFRNFFDKILIDAPCSGEGMFRKDPAVMRAWNEDSNDSFSRLQREIIDCAVQMLRPGGALLYSTCTFSPKENEESISYLLEKNPRFHLLPIEPYEGFREGLTEYGNRSQALRNCVRILPYRMRGEGHFLALLQKEEDAPEEPALLPYRNQTAPKQVQRQKELWEFLSHISRTFDGGRIELRNEKVCYLPEGLPDLSGLRIMRTGLLLGEMKKNRFEPSQALAMNLRMEEFDNACSLPSADARVIRYLKGETIDLSDMPGLRDGWVLFGVDGFPLGFGKLSGTTLKNKYLAGWRWQ